MNKQKLSLKVDRAISELRRGGQIVISDFKTGVSVLLMAAEMIDSESINDISQNTSSTPNLILSFSYINIDVLFFITILTLIKKY